jgi:hypothetical protein
MTLLRERATNRTYNLLASLIWLLLCLVYLSYDCLAQAQTPDSHNSTIQNKGLLDSGGTRNIGAARITDDIRIDGFLHEESWKLAVPATDFRQQEPYEGEPATERTEVRVLFDHKYLYIGIHAFDSEPTHINARELTRDASFSNDDKVEILLDTYHDRHNAFRFAVNPLGTQQDALITDEGRDVNLSWDAPWLSAGQIDETGYSVEIALPLTILRFNEGGKVWGFNVARIIRRKHEENLWTSWQRTFGLERVSQAGDLTGIDEIHRRRLVEFRPYVVGGWRKGLPGVGVEGFVQGFRSTSGLEVVKIGLTSSLTAEFTVNPDFGQTEVDQQVVNLSRFSVFFPEKRDFFLENAGVFLFGGEGSNQLFFTRRIGLTNDGLPIPIDYGAKITGKIGVYNVGFLQVQTRQVGEQTNIFAVPRQQFTIARLKRDIFGRSSIGAMFINRQGGSQTEHNRGGGIDAQLNISDYWRVNAFLMGSNTGSNTHAGTDPPVSNSSVLSGRIDSIYENNLVRFIGAYEDIGKSFNPEIGFVERTGIRQYFGQAAYKPRPRFLPFVRQFEFETQIEYYADREGKLATRQTELSWETTFKNSAVLFFRPMEKVMDVLTEPFEIRPGIVIPAGVYHFNRHILIFNSDRSKRVVFTAREKWGSFFSGNRYETSGGITFRPNEHFSLDLSDSFNDVRLREGKFTTNLIIGRIDYNFSRKLLTSALVQLNSVARLSDINIRMRYIYRPNSSLFVIYNQTTGKGLERPSYNFQVKLTYDFTL